LIPFAEDNLTIGIFFFHALHVLRCPDYGLPL
jgi:hypothetical protein